MDEALLWFCQWRTCQVISQFIVLLGFALIEVNKLGELLLCDCGQLFAKYLELELLDVMMSFLEFMRNFCVIWFVIIVFAELFFGCGVRVYRISKFENITRVLHFFFWQFGVKSLEIVESLCFLSNGN